MRAIVISLILFNVIFLLWNWLDHSHARELERLNATVGAGLAAMPGNRLELLSERDAASVEGVGNVQGGVLPLDTQIQEGQSDSPDKQQPGAGELAAQHPEENTCGLLGPVPDQGVAKILIQKMAALQIYPKFASIEMTGGLDYWVYLKPEPTRELAAAKLKELQDRKIDSFIIPQGALANGISLGVFDKQENAEKRQQVIAGLGYDAQLSENRRVYMENWLVFYPGESAKFSRELYLELQKDNNNLDYRKELCDKVASLIDIQ